MRDIIYILIALVVVYFILKIFFAISWLIMVILLVLLGVALIGYKSKN